MCADEAEGWDEESPDGPAHAEQGSLKGSEMKNRLVILTLSVAVLAGSMAVDTVPAFAAQKDPRCRQKDVPLLATTLEQQQADRDKDGWVCFSEKQGRYYDA